MIQILSLLTVFISNFMAAGNCGSSCGISVDVQQKHSFPPIIVIAQTPKVIIPTVANSSPTAILASVHPKRRTHEQVVIAQKQHHYETRSHSCIKP